MHFTLITGASSGIGAATAQRLATMGHNLFLVARRTDRLSALAERLRASHAVDVRFVACDITDEDAVQRLCEQQMHGLSVNVVVNNAGLALGTEAFDAYDFSEVDAMLDLNVRAMMRIAHRTLPLLRASKGHLINLGSIAGIDAYAGGTVYCATKAFVHSFTRGLRQDLLGSGVRVTTIAPGRVETEFSDVRLRGDSDAAQKVYTGYRPLRPDDVADAIAYALSCPPHVTVEFLHIMPTDQAGYRIASS